jgi:hypothetical protein
MARSFKGYVPDVAPEITLESPDGSRTITVECVPNLAGSTMLDFMAGADEEDMALMAGMVKGLLNMCIIPESQDAFWEFAGYAPNGIGVETLADVTTYLSELYSGEIPLESSMPSPAI